MACTATEWVVTMGTRTQVAEAFSPGRPRILRCSLRIFSSSKDQPSWQAAAENLLAERPGTRKAPDPSP